jgi:hypothetical protein
MARSHAALSFHGEVIWQWAGVSGDRDEVLHTVVDFVYAAWVSFMAIAGDVFAIDVHDGEFDM